MTYLQPLLVQMGCTVKEFRDCLKLYLAMESWFHDSNPMTEVKAARAFIANTISQVQKIFKRTEGDGWSCKKLTV